MLRLSFNAVLRWCAVFLLLLPLLAQTSWAQSRPTAGATQGVSSLYDAYGIRIGTGVNADEPTVHNPSANPTFSAFYEVPAGGMLLGAELYLAWNDLHHVSFPTYAETSLESYGFHALLRNPDAAGAGMHFFYQGGFGFDVYRSHVSATVPLIAGVMQDIAHGAMIELAARVSPVVFLGGNPGLSYGITLGVRFANEKEVRS